MKRTMKRFISVLLVLALCFGIVPFSAFAAPTSGILHIGYYVFETTPPASPLIGSDLRLPPKTLVSGGTHYAAYCLEHAKGSTDGAPMTEWDGIDYNLQRLYTDIMALGFQWAQPNNWGAGAPQAHQWAVTQMLIWAAENGTITKGNDKVISIPASVDAEIEKVAPHSYYPQQMKDYYYKLKADLIKLYKIPSFAAGSENDAKDAPPVKLRWDGTQYSGTVTDTNGVLGLDRYNFVLKGMTITKSGDKLTITAPTEAAANGEQVSQQATFTPPVSEEAFIALQSGSASDQKVAVYNGNSQGDPVAAYIRVSFDAVAEAGIIKVSEDGDVAGKMFQITGSDGSTTTVATDSSGRVNTDMLPMYVVTTDPESGEETQGERITYTAQEINVPSKYVIPASQTFQLFEGQDTELEFENRLKKWRVTVTKQDSEYQARAQGDSTLAGAVYGLYRNGRLIDTYTTDAQGKFTTRWYICNEVPSAIIKEITPSEGYLLDPTEYTVGVAPGSTTIEYNSMTKTVTEQVKKNQIQFVKYKEFIENERDEQIKVPEEGAEFQIWLESAGSFAVAYESEKQLITTDANGYAITKALPYGRYRIHQTKGAEGYEFVDDIIIYINEDSSEKPIPYHLTLRNTGYEAEILVMKKDAETGRVVPVSGIRFKIKDLASGEWVQQYDRYPSGQYISEFETDITGRLLLPELLPYGQYELYEMSSPYGYVLSKEPMPFTVDGTSKQVIVEKQNVPQKGYIQIFKKGEVLATVEKDGDFYKPMYELMGLPGAKFEVFAAEDIRTPDGTLRVPKDLLVDTITTDSMGVAKTKELYLGKYYLKETDVPDGYTYDGEPYYVQLSFENMEVSVTHTTVNIENERQKAKIELFKSLEEDKTYNVGLGDEWKNVRFSLFARNEIIAADGTKIPAGGLLETVGLNASRKAYFTADVPVGSKLYVKETATDNSYILSDKEYDIEFKHKSFDIPTVLISVNEGKMIDNLIKRGKVNGIKYGEEGQPLEGAVIGIFPEGTKEFTAENAIATTKSADNGAFSFANIPIGEYIVAEIAPPEGFVLTEETFPISITEHGKTVEIKLWNKYVRGNIKGFKISEKSVHGEKTFEIVGSDGSIRTVIADDENEVNTEGLPKYMTVIDAKTGEKTQQLITYTVKEVDVTIKGVVMGLFKADETEFTEDNALMTDETDKDGVFEFKDLLYNDYIVYELKQADGYILPNTIYPVTVDGEDETIEIFVVNEFTKVEISKIDITDGKELPGAKMEIRKLDGTVLHKWTSTNKPYYIEMLPVGEYILHESAAPNGYKLATDIKFGVKDTGEIQKVVMKDERVAKVPNTGGLDSPIAGLLLFGGGVLVIVLSMVAVKRKRKQKVAHEDTSKN